MKLAKQNTETSERKLLNPVTNGIYLTVFVLLLIANLFYMDPLYAKSEQVIQWVQDTFMCTPLTVLFHTLSAFGEGYIYFSTFIFMFSYSTRGRAFYYLVVLSTIMSV
jgi:hypothetical protein